MDDPALISFPNSLLPHRPPRFPSPPASFLLRDKPRRRRVSMALPAQPSSSALGKVGSITSRGDPRVCSRICFSTFKGVIGRMVAENWLQENPGGKYMITLVMQD
ncbi:hypothetical protein J5N97_028511 [Dioscorea zingiberensis]|uniref:Uncharacterized protein n=1 Tax=Dioscorea zingiberensis TaxID=325984 RepID=A0A9D5BZC2_9LILI|nr:hypothetical protein J5N97_028511 [Dioscorea zingiberensis]